MKTCARCKTRKALTDFNRCRRNPDGLQYPCRQCQRIATANSRKKQDPARVASVKQIWYTKNREVSIERAKLYREAHPEWAKEMSKRHSPTWRKRYPEKAKLLAMKQATQRRFRKHGLTQQQYDAMLDHQDHVCAACKEIPVTSSVRPGTNAYDNFVIDHDHATGKVRGLVCTNCNVALGMIRDNPDTARKLADYLEANSPMNSGLEVPPDNTSLSI